MPSTKGNKNIQEGDVVSTEEIFRNKSCLAFIIDGEVVETFLCEKRFSAILQSNPTVVEIDGPRQFFDGPFIGWNYDGEKFFRPNIDNDFNN
jgi:hypothetical protein